MDSNIDINLPIPKRPYKRKLRDFTDDDVRMIKTMWLYKFSIGDIAEKYGVKTYRIRTALQRYI